MKGNRKDNSSWMMRTSAPSEPALIKRDLERLMRGSAGWDKPGR